MVEKVLNLSVLQIIIILVSPLVWWLIFVLFYYHKNKEFKLVGYDFSLFRYVILVFSFCIPIFLYIIFTKEYSLFLLFILFGIGGVIGELLLSFWWRQFFWKGFWDYKHAAIIFGDTSLLNFPAWSVGGFLILFSFYLFRDFNLLTFFDFNNSNEIFHFIIGVSLFTIIGILFSITLGRIIFRKDFRGKTLGRYAVFSSGIILFLILVTYFLGWSWFFMALFWGSFCFVTEYLFGKSSVKFIGKKLWFYNYLTIDNKHTTFLNILPFCMGGFYFFTIYLLFNLLPFI